MTVLRWIAAVVCTLIATGAIASFFLSVSFDSNVWRERASSLGRWLRLLALLWFNVEVWGRVVMTVIRWK